MNMNSTNVALNGDYKVSSEFVKKMWLIEYRIVNDFYNCGWVSDCIIIIHEVFTCKSTDSNSL